VVTTVNDSNPLDEATLDLGDLSESPPPERPRRSGRGHLGSVLIGIALVAVLAMIATAVLRMVRADEDSATPHDHAYQYETPNAFVVDTVDDYQPYAITMPNDVIVDLGTGHVEPLPASVRRRVGGAANYQPSPNGRQIAFEGSAGRHDHLLYLAKVDGSQVHLAIARSTAVSTPSWSLDGTQIVYVGADDAIFVLDVSSGTVRRVFHRSYPEKVWLPSFTPDGTSILFTRRHGHRLGLWSIPATGGKPTLLRQDAAFGAYSPDGSTIAFHRIGGPDTGVWFPFDFRISLIASDGNHPRGLGVHNPGCCTMADGFEWDWTRPVWSPDGTKLVFQRFGQVPGDILVVDVDTHMSTAIGEGAYPTWFDDHSLIVEDYDPPAGGLIVEGGSR